ncbi:MAG: hypothetical protein EOO77_07435 [Oxalobacteraceae bacterium]|nr:MAG: hypothetical protein EOO77_07435 [Oxalobacteraceae bacterium]
MLFLMLVVAASQAAQPISPEMREAIVTNMCKPAFDSNGAMKLDDFIPPKFPQSERAKVRRICDEYLQERSRANSRR